MDSIHTYTTMLGTQKKGKGTSLTGLFHEIGWIFMSLHEETLNEIAEESSQWI